MTTIGAFTRTPDGYEGEIITLSVQSTHVRILPNPEAGDANTASHVVCVGQAIAGQGWPADPDSGAMIALTLDDPSFVAPIRALLMPTGTPDRFKLVWRRSH